MSRRHDRERESARYTTSREERPSDRRDRGDTRSSGTTERDPGSRTPRHGSTAVETTRAFVDSRLAPDPRGGVVTSRTAPHIRPGDPGDPRDPRDSITSPREPRDEYNEDTRMGGLDARERRGTDPTRDIRGPTGPRDVQDPRSPPVDSTSRQNEYFLPGEDINREVITADICKYLGRDALVRPYIHQDGRKGYLIRAYRAMTTPMITSLKDDSRRYESESRRREAQGIRPKPYASTGFDQTRDYGDDHDTAPMSRGDSRFRDEPNVRRYRAPSPDYDDMEIDPPSTDPRDPRYGREGPLFNPRDPRYGREPPVVDARDPRYGRDAREVYDSRDPRPQVPLPAGYAQPGRDSYQHEGRADPRGYSGQQMPPERDYGRGETRPVYADPRTGQPVYLPADGRGGPPIYPPTDPRGAQSMYVPVPGPGDPYAGGPPGSIPRGRDDVYIDPRTGVPVSRPSATDRHAPSGRANVDYDRRGYR